MNLSNYAQQWLRYHKGYENYAFKVFRKALKQSFASLPIDNITYDNYKIIVPLNVHQEPIREAYFNVYQKVGFLHGKRVGLGINRDIKDFNLPFFNEEFYKDLLAWLTENAGERITSVNETTVERIQIAIEVAQRKNFSVDEMRKHLQHTIDSPGFTKYAALRIARTEVGSAANFAASKAADSSGIVLEKIWISIPDSRVRDGKGEDWNHQSMNGQTVDQYEPFVMKSTKGVINEMMFPCDVNGSAGNVINCRCAVAYRGKRDADGFVIRR